VPVQDARRRLTVRRADRSLTRKGAVEGVLIGALAWLTAFVLPPWCRLVCHGDRVNLGFVGFRALRCCFFLGRG